MIKPIQLVFASLILPLTAFAQVLAIDPADEGGFENATTFEANGWTVVNPTGNNTNRRWYVGTGQEGFTGNRAAFIGNNETTVGTPTGARTVHFYRSVTFPDNAQNIVLTFKYKQAVSDFSNGTYSDYLLVSTAVAAPVNGNQPPGQQRFGPFPDTGVPLFTTQTVNLPNSLAGKTRNLIFTYTCNNVAPHGYGAIDDISLTYDTAMAVTEFGQQKLIVFPNPAENILHLNSTEPIDRLQIFNIIGQSVFDKAVNEKTLKVDLSGFAPGNYLLKVYTAYGTSMRKFVKK